MAAVLWSVLNTCTQNQIRNNIFTTVRHGHHLRGKAPDVARSLDQRLNELNFKDPALHYRVDIGFPQPSKNRASELRKRIQLVKENKTSTELEKLARKRQLLINLEEVHQDWLKTAGPYQIKQIADHYSIYEHLYGDAYFVPRKPIEILYETDDLRSPVLYGNVIKPNDATKEPSVQFESAENELWTLVMTNLDGHFTETNAEYLHWFIGNIPGNKISNGEVIMDYLQPFPPKGTGFHRHVFILYKQANKLDFSALKKQGPCLNLADRTFSTLDFYKQRQNEITPYGLAFFQSDWDKTLTDFYHNTLNMREPNFEYDFPAPYIRPQEWFPLRKPFNIYMDKYKDPKEVSERYLNLKLNDTHPFDGPKARLPFPNAEPIPASVPSWLKLEIKKRRMGWGRINDV